MHLLLFSILFTLSYNYNIREYSYYDFIQEGIVSEYDVIGGQTYKISYEKGDVTQKYLRIIAIPEIDESLFIYYSPISEKREDAVLLNYGKDEISLYINKAFTKSEADGDIYLTIACFSSQCSFEFSILQLDEIDLARNGQYSYFTTDKKNIQNTIKVFRADSESQEGFLTFWASGSKDIQMNAKYVDESKGTETTINVSQMENGKYAFFNEKNYPINYEKNSLTNYYIIEVTSPANSLISVGSNLNLIQNNNVVTYYAPNSREIIGALNNNAPKQCFNFGINNSHSLIYYLNILDFQRNININVINKDGDEITNYETKDGRILISITEDNYKNYYCLSKKNNDDIEVTFALQVTFDVENNFYKNIYAPQINGYFYERFLGPGQFTFYTGLSSLQFKTELRFYLKVNSGFPELYFTKCTNFPYCDFDYNKLPTGTIKVNKINDMFSYSIYKTEISKAISQEQYVLFVFCNIEQSCSFETNFYSELDKLVLPKDTKIYQTIMDEGQSNLVIKLDGENDYNQVFVDFLTYSGDINIKYKADGFSVREYVAANKKYFVLDKTNENIISSGANEIYFYVTGEMASYYSVDYKLIVKEEDKKIMTEESGINYLETIEPKFGSKTISLINKRINDKRNFLVNFYSLNCEIGITRKINGKEKQLEPIDYLSQDIILSTDEEYNSEKYDYYMEIIKMDNTTSFDTNWCMVYVSSIQSNLNNDLDYQKTQLLVSEGVINQVILSQSFPKIEYIYPHINPSGYVIINLNMETNSKINLKINIENKTYKEITTGRSQYIIIEESILRSSDYCPLVNTRPNQICNIVIDISLDSEFYNDEPIIEFSIKSKEEIPTYISKSMLRRDIIVGNYYQYYFTEIGKNEEGNININFDYGNGNVYGRIVQKNTDEGSGWMSKFILPNEKNNQLKYDYYNKKIYYNSEHTKNCDYGCYLFIKVEPNFSDVYYKNENIAYPISLSINSNDASIPFKSNLLNSLDIPINEYTIGDTIPLSGSFNNFYTFWIPYDCEEIIFEFIGDSTYIFINIGNTKPTSDKSDFKLNEVGQDNILRLTKTEILQKVSTTVNSLKNVQLTIAVGAKYKDDEESSLYSFRIRALRKDEIELIPLTANQKTLCGISGKKGNCYFIVPYHKKVDDQNNFFFHALEIPNVEFNYYAYEVNKDYITNRNNEEILKILQNKGNAKWSSNNSKGNYLYIDNSEISDKENGVYLLLNIEISSPMKNNDEKTVISLLHSVYSYKGFILPNPSSPQVFIVNNNNLNELYLNFAPYNRNLIVHIKLISGKGKVFWDLSDDIQLNQNKFNNINSEDENSYYYLNNPYDSLSLTIGNSEIFPLHFINNEPNINIKDSNNQPGFGFYIYYERVPKTQNYHYLPYGESSLFSFIDNDFPFEFYSRIPDKSHAVDITFKLNSLVEKSSSISYLKDEKTESQILSYDEFIINGIVLDEDFIYNKKSNSELTPDKSKTFSGKYDPIEKIFRIQFTSDIINNYKINGNNYLYVSISKGKDNNHIYKEVSMEWNILPSNDDGYYPEINKYINGKIPYEQNGYSKYELTRVNSFYKYMRIEFSTNSDKINFALNSFKITDDVTKIDYYNNNTEFYSEKFYNGKSVLIISLEDENIKSIHLSIFNIENNHINKEKDLSNFIFKYELNYTYNFAEIKPEFENITDYNYYRSAVYITLPNIKGISSNSQVNYIAKLIPLDFVVENENFYSISLLESKTNRIYTKALDDLGEDKRVELNDVHNDTAYYVVVNCEVKDNNFEEKFGFKYIYNPTNYQKEEEKGRVSLAVVLVVIFSFTGLVILFTIIFLYLKKTNLKKSIQLEELNQQLNKSNVLQTSSTL